jgi:hypothetical protein
MGDVNSMDYYPSKGPCKYLLYFQEKQGRQLKEDIANGIPHAQTVFNFMKAGLKSAPDIGHPSAEVDEMAFEKSVSAIKMIMKLRKQKAT